MQLQCPQCSQVIEFSTGAPKFCSHCGEPLPDMNASEVTTTLASGPRHPVGQIKAPESVAGYRLLGELGRGGMGVVYEAAEAKTGRRVAVKLLPQNVQRTDDTVQRFLREGELAASLSHPRSTFIYSAGEDNGLFYIVMELMSGGTLKDIVDAQGALPIEQAVDFVLDVIEGLEAAHAAGVIHRDVKPSNCFLDLQGRAKVGDYGLSKSLVSDAALTRTGAFMGTPQFAAPEQIKSERIDERTDVYAVGATLYYLIAGEAPFVGDVAKVIAGIAAERAPKLSERVSGVPKSLERLVSDCLAKDPALRPQTLAVLRTGLTPFSSRSSSIADLGRRLAAYFIDVVLVGIANGLLGLLAGIGVLVVGAEYAQPVFSQWYVQTTMAVLMGALGVLYFAVAESRYGCGLGKKMMGLRVVGPVGEAPRFFRSLLRAAFVPGLMVVAVRILPYVSGLTIVEPMQRPTQANFVVLILVQQIYPALGWLLTLACLTTMRKASGYRGIHELVSGTRVIRYATETSTRQTDSIPITVPVAAKSATRIASFQLLGELGHFGSTQANYARDDALGRSVWIFVADADQESLFSSERIVVSRPSRQHWLQGDEADGKRWDAVEAVRGLPLIQHLRQTQSLPWDARRFLLLQLLGELTASMEDGTLPQTLTVEQVWIDHTRQVKLIDIPLVGHVADEPAVIAGDDGQRCVKLLRSVFTSCSQDQLLPGHALDFAEQLAHRPDETATLVWAASQLQAMPDRPSTLRWDDRLGVLAVSMCTEMALYSSLAFILAIMVTNVAAVAMVPAIFLSAGVVLTIPASLGYLFRGGPVFHLTAIQLRRNNGELASRLQGAWRSFVVWLPWVVGYCVLAALTSMMVRSGGELDVSDPNSLLAVVATSFSWMGAAVVHVGAACYALFQPRRGVQDWLAGTQLVPS